MEVATPMDGSRKYPYALGEYVDLHFISYSIEKYGDATVSLIDYTDGIVTMECELKQYGNYNSLNFPSYEIDSHNYQNNFMFYLYPCEDPMLFNGPNGGWLIAKEDVRVACETTEKIKFDVPDGNQYVALVWYTVKEDGGEFDFVDSNGEMYGHLIFYDLTQKAE